MSLHALRWGCCCCLAIAATATVTVTAASDDRARIDSQRQSLEAGFAADDAACRKRFVVTQCVDDVKARRRNALATLREEELRLDEAGRHQRAAMRQQTLQQNEAAAAKALAPLPGASHAIARAAPPPEPPDPQHQPRLRDAREAEAASRRAVAAQRLRESASEERQKIAAREAERARNPKRSASLPTPGEPAGSAPSR